MADFDFQADKQKLTSSVLLASEEILMTHDRKDLDGWGEKWLSNLGKILFPD